MEKAKTKYIYETTVIKFVNEKVIEKRQENGQEIEVSKTVNVKKPIKIAIQKPERRKYKDSEIFFAKRLSVYLKEGLLPYSLVSKRYMNDGGPMSEDEKKALNSLRDKYNKIQTEYFAMETPLTEENTKRRGEILLEMNEINKVLSEVQNSFSSLFENTAEAKSKGDTIEWWILNLSLIDDEDKGYHLLYGDGDFDSKMDKLDEIEQVADPFTDEVVRKLSYFISFWYSAGNQVKEEDFKSAESHYEKNVSTYLVDNDPDAKIEVVIPKETPQTEVSTPEATNP
jgi:hypothetical protein